MKKKDQISPFRARELLYDYAKKSLSEERRTAVEQNLNRDSDLKLALRSLETKLHELRGFDMMEPSDLWIQELSLPHPSLTQQIVSIERRVAPRFWKALPVAVLSLSVVMGVVLFKPWTWVKLDEVELAEVAPTDEELQMEEAIAMSEKEIEGAIQAQKQNEAAPPSDPADSRIEFSTASSSATAPTPPRASEKKPTERKAQMGQLYRAFMTVDDLNRVTENAVAKIRNLGGKKAGQVELGWKRDDDERYFHFSMPEENKQALLDYLSNFSQVRLSSQEHPLVMPHGKIRIILVVKQNPGSASTPDSTSPPAMAPEEIPTSEQKETSQ